MFFVIPGESLINPLMLNDTQVIGLDVIKAPSSSNFPYWYEFVVQDEANLVAKIQANLKSDWYAAGFSERSVTIIFTDKTFQVIDDDKLTGEAEPARQYGEAHGIQSEFLNWKERQRVYLEKLNQARRT